MLGLTGTVQTGKSELAKVFEECGFTFYDLNDPQCDLRAKGTPRYDMFEAQFPGALRDDGAKLPQFYDSVTREFYHPRIQEDIELLVPIVQKLCTDAATESRRIVLSWEYLAELAKHLPLDHTLLMTINEKMWMKRLEARLKGRGMTGEVTLARVHKIIDLLYVWPYNIQQDVEREMAGNFTTFDVSAEDWNAGLLRKLLKSL